MLRVPSRMATNRKRMPRSPRRTPQRRCLAKPPVFPPPPIPAPTSKPDVRFEPKADQPAAPAPAPGAQKHASAGETPPDKAAHKDEDPFADLGSLEAEMARLLGRGTQK